MLITIGKRTVYAVIICVALLFIALGSMWCLSSHYKIYGVPVLNYHQVNDKYHSALTLDVAQFKKQMITYITKCIIRLVSMIYMRM